MIDLLNILRDILYTEKCSIQFPDIHVGNDPVTALILFIECCNIIGLKSLFHLAFDERCGILRLIIAKEHAIPVRDKAAPFILNIFI